MIFPRLAAAIVTASLAPGVAHAEGDLQSVFVELDQKAEAVTDDGMFGLLCAEQVSAIEERLEFADGSKEKAQLVKRLKAAQQCLSNNRALRRAAVAIAKRCNPVLEALNRYLGASENSAAGKRYRWASTQEPACVQDCRDWLKKFQNHSQLVSRVSGVN